MSSHRPKILIIDDDPDIFATMTEILAEEGYDLFSATNGREGLEKALFIHPDLIFLDMCMPVLDGVGFLKELNQRGVATCPVLVITGYEDDLMLHESFDQGIFSLVHKPFRSSEIKGLCRRYTGLTEIRRRLSFNLDTVTFLSQQASFFGLDNLEEQELIEALPFPVFVKNRDRKLIQVNKAFENFTGLDRDVIVGKCCEDITLCKQFIANNHDIELSLVTDGGVHRHEQIVTDRQGVQRDVIIFRSAVYNGGHERPVGILGVLIDTTEYGFASFNKMLVGRYPNLSGREREVANLIRLGMSNKEVARQLNVALCTVEFHRANLREKMGLKKGDNVNLSTALLSL